MKILVTGAKGFVGKNLVVELRNRGYRDIFEYDIDTPPALLEEYSRQCEFVFHLAGVNRPQDEKEFMEGNFGFTSTLLACLKKHANRAPILITSSIQATLDNPYGKSKKAGEDLMFAYGRENDSKVLVYRLSNLFGKWCRPNYNSVVATFCHNIANDLPIKINDPDVRLRLCYIDDVVGEFIAGLEAKENRAADGFCFVPQEYEIKLGDLASRLFAFIDNRKTLVMPALQDGIDKALYATLMSYLPHDKFGYPLDMKRDNRGWLAEFIKTGSFGQIFVSKTKPGVTRGNHWHHTKIEKFLVIQGEALIKFRKIDEEKVVEYQVTGEKLEVLDIPAGYTHSITNTGTGELITLFWADEIFDPAKPDTYYTEV
jgi:UDP-2-acetamido-2,6-beta-L-arabino-hexul-4-ose reductase